MFSSFYPRPQSYYQPSAYHHPSAYHQPSAYARALAQQQEQERARARAIAQQQEEQRARAYWQEMERQRLARSRYLPEDEEEDYYLTPRQRALLEARRRQEALEQRRLAAARLAHENALKQQQARAAEKESTPPRRSVSPLATERASPSPKPASPAPQPSSSSPSPERLEEAATKIQTQYRIHRALRAISALAAEFDSLKSSFVPPTTIDYQARDGAVVSLPVPESPNTLSSDGDAAKLAFTPTNVPLHTYAELLSRLLVRLDAVESRGDRKVRERRRSVVRAVEAEAARVEAFWRGVWAAAQQEVRHEQEEEQGVKEDEEEEVAAMVVDQEAAAPLPELAAPESDSELDSDFSTPPASPAASPELVLPPESESAEDGVVVDMLATEEEKAPADDFVLV